MLTIDNVEISKNPILTNEVFLIQVTVTETLTKWSDVKAHTWGTLKAKTWGEVKLGLNSNSDTSLKWGDIKNKTWGDLKADTWAKVKNI
jgi:hypothetical protein